MLHQAPPACPLPCLCAHLGTLPDDLPHMLEAPSVLPDLDDVDDVHAGECVRPMRSSEDLPCIGLFLWCQ